MTKRTPPLFSVSLKDSWDVGYQPPEDCHVRLESWIAKEAIIEQMSKLQLRAILWRSLMKKKSSTDKIFEDVVEYAIALQASDDCPLTRWIFGDALALPCQPWMVPLGDWRGSINALIDALYAYTKRSDWHASHCRAFWKELALAAHLGMWGWPNQTVYCADDKTLEDVGSRGDSEVPF
jgi:hypothetical protein